MKILKNEIKNYLYILSGVILISVGINIFYIPNELVSGGISGIGIVIMYLSEKFLSFSFPISLINIILNIALFLLAYKYFGGKYIKRSFAATLLFSLALQCTAFLPQYKGDLMLASIFGGIIMGSGVGFVLNGSATTGGTETAAHILHHINNRLSVSNYIFIIDSLIIIAGFFAFGAEKAMFAIISVFVASKCIDMVASGSSLDKAAVIISSKACIISGKIKECISSENAYKLSMPFKNILPDYIVCIFSQKETRQIKEIIKSVDNSAFIILFDIKEVYGEEFKKL